VEIESLEGKGAPCVAAETCWSPFYEQPRPADLLWRIGGFRIVRCRDSGLVYLANPLSEQELREFYSREYFEGEPSRRGYPAYADDEPILRVNFRDLLNGILKRLAESGRDPRAMTLLENGCAYGFSLDEARKHFGQVRGIEINEEVAAEARRRFGLDVLCGPDALAVVAPGSVDVVVMWDTIEHLMRPRSVLIECARVLKPGGELYLTTGDIGSALARLLGRRWRLINPPQHICYFSAATLERLLGECGFETVSVARCGKKVSLGFLLFIANYLLGRRKTPNIPAWLKRRSLYLNLHDVMLMHGRKLQIIQQTN
jgi:SAM-dependent methyltransferase